MTTQAASVGHICPQAFWQFESRARFERAREAVETVAPYCRVRIDGRRITAYEIPQYAVERINALLDA
jgi:hypothetical protein